MSFDWNHYQRLSVGYIQDHFDVNFFGMNKAVHPHIMCQMESEIVTVRQNQISRQLLKDHDPMPIEQGKKRAGSADDL